MLPHDPPITRWLLRLSVLGLGVYAVAGADSTLPIASSRSDATAASLGRTVPTVPQPTPPPRDYPLPPDRNTLVIDGLGTFTMVLFETASPHEDDENAFQIALHKHRNLPGPPPVEIERYKVFWGLLEDGTCLYSDRPDYRGAPYVRGRLRPDDLADLQERAACLISVGRDPHLCYPETVCTMALRTITLKTTIDGVPVSTSLLADDFFPAFESRPYRGFQLNAAQEAYRQGFADLARHLLALRSTSFTETVPVPKSARVRSVPIRQPKT